MRDVSLTIGSMIPTPRIVRSPIARAIGVHNTSLQWIEMAPCKLRLCGHTFPVIFLEQWDDEVAEIRVLQFSRAETT
jgi:hypothetical protein